MSIIGSEKGIHSPEFHKKKRREQYVKRTLIALAVIIIIGAPIYVARMHRFLISSIEVSGNEVTKSEDIEQIVARDLSGDYLWVFPKSNSLLYPKKEIISDLMREEPRFSSVSVTKPSLTSMKVAVTERAPVAEYCKDVSDPSTPSGCYFIDDTGYIFASAPAFSGDVYLAFTTQTSFDNPVGETVLPPADFSAARAFVQSLGSLGIYPRVFLIEPDEYHVILAGGADIMWSKSAKFDDVLTNLTSFFADTDAASSPTFLSRVAYIDMRFDDKIFYKFRGE